MRYASIRDRDIVNGEGIAVSLFVQGCSHHCKGCFNPDTWSFTQGREWNKEIEDKFIELCQDPIIDCVSILGGEPFDQNDDIYSLLKRVKQEVNKPVYLWTGYTFEYLMENNITAKKCFLEGLVDWLIDGKFEIGNLKLDLKLRGSTNQRIINVREKLNGI